jgi:catechol 2,3-dioxygenase-like lactoylglutathione lyase family enzyme
MIGSNPVHANFSVDNIETAKQFYVDKLGFGLVSEGMGMIMLGAGNGTKINVYEKPDHQAWDSTVLGIEVPDVYAALEELGQQGVMAERLPMTDDKGVMHDPEHGDAAWFRDPAGNWLCVNNMK